MKFKLLICLLNLLLIASCSTKKTTQDSLNVVDIDKKTNPLIPSIENDVEIFKNESINDFFEVVREDKHGCFFG